MGTQKNRLDETVHLSTQNICEKMWVRKYLQFYAEKMCLSKHMIIDQVCMQFVMHQDEWFMLLGLSIGMHC